MGERNGFQHELQFPSDPALAQQIHADLLSKLKDHRFSDKVVLGIKLAVEEALVNAIKHGNQLDRAKQVRVRYRVDALEFVIEVEDEGPGFKPSDVPDPTAPENLDRPCGRGLLLMRHYMTECDFVHPGNVCRMRRVRG